MDTFDFPVPATKTAMSLLQHLWDRGGCIYRDHADNSFHHSWGTLLKDGDVKWHSQRVTESTFDQIHPYLKVLEIDDVMGTTEFEIDFSRTGLLFSRILEQKWKAVRS